MSPPLTPPSSSPTDYALTLSANLCFHQWTTFTAPNTDQICKVSFSTTSSFDEEGAERLPTIFIVAPMVASRYFLVWYDHLARKMGVRLVLMDRPGFGLTPRCPHSSRAATTLAATSAVLDHLKVKSTAFLSVSAGAVHLLNSLSSLRHYFHPKHPYAAAMCPWVLPKYSKCNLLAVATMLPDSWISSFGGMQQFVVHNVVPASSWSGGIFDQVGSFFKAGGKDERDSSEDEEKLLECYGVGEEYKDELDKVVMKFVFAEDFGVNDEAPFNLQKNIPESYWGAAASYPGVLASLVDAEKARRSGQTDECSPFRFRAFFAASDMLIGDGGKVYFDSVFKEAGGAEGVINYVSETVPKTNHETIINAIKGPLVKVFKEVKHGWEDGLDLN